MMNAVYALLAPAFLSGVFLIIMLMFAWFFFELVTMILEWFRGM